jgi:ribosomal protein L32
MRKRNVVNQRRRRRRAHPGLSLIAKEFWRK